jgi:hypothetical protein
MLQLTPNTKPDPVTLITRTKKSTDLEERLLGFSVRVKVIPDLRKERT